MIHRLRPARFARGLLVLASALLAWLGAGQSAFAQTVLLSNTASNGYHVLVIRQEPADEFILAEVTIDVTSPSGEMMSSSVQMTSQGTVHGRMWDPNNPGPFGFDNFLWWTFQLGPGDNFSQARFNGDFIASDEPLGFMWISPAWATVSEVQASPNAWSLLAQEMRTYHSGGFFRSAETAMAQVGLAPDKAAVPSPTNQAWALYYFMQSTLAPPPCTHAQPWQCRAWAREMYWAWAFAHCMFFVNGC